MLHFCQGNPVAQPMGEREGGGGSDLLLQLLLTILLLQLTTTVIEEKKKKKASGGGGPAASQDLARRTRRCCCRSVTSSSCQFIHSLSLDVVAAASFKSEAAFLSCNRLGALRLGLGHRRSSRQRLPPFLSSRCTHTHCMHTVPSCVQDTEFTFQK